MVAIYIQITQLSCNGSSTCYVAVFCRTLPYSASYNILLNSASHNILPNSASRIILPNSASRNILPNSASYNILPNSASRNILLNSAGCSSYSLLTQPLTYIRRVFILINVSSALFRFTFVIVFTGLF